MIIVMNGLKMLTMKSKKFNKVSKIFFQKRGVNPSFLAGQDLHHNFFCLTHRDFCFHIHGDFPLTFTFVGR